MDDLSKQQPEGATAANAEGASEEGVGADNNANHVEKEKIDEAKAMSLLYSQPRIYMTPNRYVKLIEEITVVYYHEQRNEILTGHRNGSICIWN